jgi:hypothetical protein
VLVSGSPFPPTVVVQDLRFGGGAKVNLQLGDVESSAVFAAFQDDENVDGDSSRMLLVVGFQDGTLSVFKMGRLSRGPSFLDCLLDATQTFSLQPSRVGSIKKLHKAAMGGITSAAFLPGYKSRIVTIGHDGRCRLVDFESGGGRILRT